MLRNAVNHRLGDQVGGLGGRVYEAFLAPSDAVKPYATVKLPGGAGSAEIGYAGTTAVEVRLYLDPTTFRDLDVLAQEVLAALNGQLIADPDDGQVYHLLYQPGGGDFVDDQKNLIGRLLLFETAAVFEPTTGGG